MRNSILIVLGLALVGCVDGEQAPVATVTAPAPPARALVARQMPTLPSQPLPEPATSDPWPPSNLYTRDEDGRLYDAEGHEIDLDEERGIARLHEGPDYDRSSGRHLYGGEPEHDGEPEDCRGEEPYGGEPEHDGEPEDCRGEEPNGYERGYGRDEAHDPINPCEGCAEEPGYERDYDRDEANDPINLDVEGEPSPAESGLCEHCD